MQPPTRPDDLAFLPPETSTSPKIVYASKYSTFQKAVDAAGSGGLLILDRRFENIAATVMLPPQIRVMGMGPFSESILTFNLGEGVSAIKVSEPTGTGACSSDPGTGDKTCSVWVTLENLGIFSSNPAQNTTIGIDLKERSLVFLTAVTVMDFGVGVNGWNSYSVHAHNCNVSSNRTNYLLGHESYSWRILGGVSSWSRKYAIEVSGGNNNVIDSVRMESNGNALQGAAIRANGEQIHVMNGRFEGNYRNIEYTANARNVVQVGNALSPELDGDYASASTLLKDAALAVALDIGKNARVPVVERYMDFHNSNMYGPAGSLYGDVVGNTYRMSILSNQTTRDGASYSASNESYSGWSVDLSGAPANAPANDSVSFHHRAAGEDEGKGTKVFEVSGSGNVTALGTVTASNIAQPSDARLKEAIEPLTGVWERLESVRGVKFKWKKGGSGDFGVIAQDVEKSFPEAVVIGADGQRAVNYGKLVAPLIEAVRDLKQENEGLKKRLDQLENRSPAKK